jgi:RHS repeat-associated protein
VRSPDYTGTTAHPAGVIPEAAKTVVYDGWGRQVRYRDENGLETVTTYDGAGRVATVTDPEGTTSYGYEVLDAAGKAEHRGLLTQVSVTRGGTAGALTYTGAYDANGALVLQVLPGGVAQHTSYDEAGEPVGMGYTGQVTPVTESTAADGSSVYTPGTPDPDGSWMAWSQTNDVTGRVTLEHTGAGAVFDGVPGVSDVSDVSAPTVGKGAPYERSYGYDPAGRLAKVVDRTGTHGTPVTGATPCTVRQYAFNANGNRTALTAATHGDGDCAGTPSATTTTAYGYDTADRPTTAGAVDGATPGGSYVYDGFGRQTTVPAADAPDPGAGDITLGYHDDDLPRTITQGDMSTVYELDSAGRRHKATTTTGTGSAASTATVVRHYTDTSDNPAWTTDGAGSLLERYGESLGGDLAATITGDGAATLTLANLHGHVVSTVEIPATQDGATPATAVTGWSDYTEYGAPREAGATTAVAGTLGYGWLGAKQRSTTASSAGLTLMGVRLYNPSRGLFTSTDPIPGGNDNAYTYPTDPINKTDLDGRHGTAARWARRAAKAHTCLMSLALCGFRYGNYSVSICTWVCASVHASGHKRIQVGYGVGGFSTKSARGVGAVAMWSRGGLPATSVGATGCFRICYGRYRSAGKWNSSFGVGTSGGYAGYTHIQYRTMGRPRNGWFTKLLTYV